MFRPYVKVLYFILHAIYAIAILIGSNYDVVTRGKLKTGTGHIIPMGR